ncbi:hypothetical protein V1264_023288 [Littorina saxatilis]
MGSSADDVSNFPSDETDIISTSQKDCAVDILTSLQTKRDSELSSVFDDVDVMTQQDSTCQAIENDVSLLAVRVSSSTPCFSPNRDGQSSVRGVLCTVSEEELDDSHTSATVPASKLTSNDEKHPSSFSSYCSLSVSQSNDSVCDSAPALTVSQSKEVKRKSPACSSASSVCVSESESESSHASTVRNGPFSSGSSLSTVPDEVWSSTDVAQTSHDADKVNTSEIASKTPLDASQDSEGSSLCSFGEDSICSSSANDLYAEDDAKKGKRRDRRYSADMSSADSDDHLSASQNRLPISRSRTGTPEHLRPEAFFLPKEMLKASENRPALPERYRHVLRKSGSYGSLRSYGNSNGCQSDDQDLNSREKDLGSALAWIRHEMVQMKEQDKVLLKRFIELRASILQLRCMYDVMGSTSDLSSMDGSSLSLNEVRKTTRMRNLVRTESDAMMSGGMFKATSSLSLPCSPQLSRLRWKSDDLI